MGGQHRAAPAKLTIATSVPQHKWRERVRQGLWEVSQDGTCSRMPHRRPGFCRLRSGCPWPDSWIAKRRTGAGAWLGRCSKASPILVNHPRRGKAIVGHSRWRTQGRRMSSSPRSSSSSWSCCWSSGSCWISIMICSYSYRVRPASSISRSIRAMISASNS